jgi:hypothetical protein
LAVQGYAEELPQSPVDRNTLALLVQQRGVSHLLEHGDEATIAELQQALEYGGYGEIPLHRECVPRMPLDHILSMFVHTFEHMPSHLRALR